MSKSLKRVKLALAAAEIEARVLEMGGETRTAEAAAREVGCALDQIAKSIIFEGRSSGAITLFITAGGNQVDLELAAAVAEEELDRADADKVRAKTGFAIGGVAPVGHLTAPKAFFDPRLLEFSVVYAAAGTPRHVFSVNPNDLLRVCSAQVAVFTP